MTIREVYDKADILAYADVKNGREHRTFKQIMEACFENSNFQNHPRYEDFCDNVEDIYSCNYQCYKGE